MDGPNVNWRLFDKVNEEVKEEYNTSLLNIGSCGFHKVHIPSDLAVSPLDGVLVPF